MAFDRTKPYCARNGQKAEIVETLKDGRFLVVYGDGSHSGVVLPNGFWLTDTTERDWDLVNIPEKRVVVINHYRNGDTFYYSQETADRAANSKRLGCTVVEYERPVYVE